jgi:DNA invertase Pin-like site-specific DNA recombinase
MDCKTHSLAGIHFIVFNNMILILKIEYRQYMRYAHSVHIMKMAFAYVRVSGKGQLEGDGFARQREAIELYARANDIEIVQTFEEEGVSGKTDLENRPALTDLIASLSVAGTRLVLVERLDRLARFLTVQESILQDLKRKQFDLVSVTEPDLCSDDPTRTLMRQVLGAFSEYERSMIVLKLRGARQRMKKKSGRCEGRKPYGRTLAERETIQRMKALRGGRYSYGQIAAALDGEGLPPRSGEKWNAIVVNRILRVQARIELEPRSAGA